jgi:tetratricopeptide (TPR) repeat protein
MWFRTLFAFLLLTHAVWPKPSADALCQEADILVQQHQLKPALKKYFQALEQDKRCARAHASLGRLYYLASQNGGVKARSDPLTKTAVLALSRAIELNPKDGQSYFYRGDLLVNEGKYPTALKDLNRSLALRPDAMTYLSRAVCYSGLKQDEKAVADYTRVYQMTRDATCLFGRANAYQRLNRFDEALADYELVAKEGKEPKSAALAKQELKAFQRGVGKASSLRSKSSQAIVLFEKARTLKNTGHPKQSLLLFDKALELDPKFAKAATYKGDAYFVMGDWDHAVEWYRKGIQLDPEDKQAHRFLGDTLEKKYEQTKKRSYLEEAIRCYEAALRLDPGYGFAKQNLLFAKERLKKL